MVSILAIYWIGDRDCTCIELYPAQYMMLQLGLGGLSLRKPDQLALPDLISSFKRARANHAYEGRTQSTTGPGALGPGWNVDYDCVQVGKGKQAYARARRYISEWQHMELGWVGTNRPPPRVGAELCVMAQVLGLLWTSNPLRIIYEGEAKASVPDAEVTHARRQPPCTCKGVRYDLGQVTLQGHSLAGEERFSVQWCQEDDSVWYEVYAISRPATLLAIASYPLTRYYQDRFRRESAAAVRAAVASL